MLALFAGVLAVGAQSIASYAAVNTPATEASLSSLEQVQYVPAADASTTNSLSFATKIVVPDNATVVSITYLDFTLDRIVGGVPSTLFNQQSMNASSYTYEGSTSSPNIFARDGGGSIITMAGTVQNNPIPNGKTIFITKHGIPLGTGPFLKMTQAGDMYRLRRTVNVSWTVSGVPSGMNFTTGAMVMIGQKPNITSTTTSNGEVTLTVEGVTEADYGTGWKIYTSLDLGITDPWVVATNGTVSAGPTVKFTQDPNEPARFWKVGYLKP